LRFSRRADGRSGKTPVSARNTYPAANISPQQLIAKFMQLAGYRCQRWHFPFGIDAPSLGKQFKKN
jgi:hypothetical protein